MPINITDVDTFTATVTAPADADPADAVEPRATAQQLANRTRNLHNRTTTVEARIVSDEWTYPSAKTRVRTVSPFACYGVSGTAGDGQAWQFVKGGGGSTSAPYLVSDVNNARLVLNLSTLLPAGSTITLIRILLTPGASRTAMSSIPGDAGRMYAALYSTALNFTTPGFTPQGPFFAAEDAGGTSLQTLTVTPSPAWQIGTKVAGDSMLVIHAGNTGGSALDAVYGIEITYTDPGPRNL